MVTKPEVFIVESLEFKDEEEERFEGKILAEILRLGGKKPRYYYVRTKRELKKVLVMFKNSEYRYLHLSCHGNSASIATTLDTIEFQELGKLLNPYLKGRRLFISSCEVVNNQLAEAVMQTSGCLSIFGPSVEVGFDEAAIMWASFYHLAFCKNEKAMNLKDIRSILKELAKLFEVSVAYCGSRSKSGGSYQVKILEGSRVPSPPTALETQ